MFIGREKQKGIILQDIYKDQLRAQKHKSQLLNITTNNFNKEEAQAFELKECIKMTHLLAK